MTKHGQAQLLFHGIVVLLIGLLCGIPYSQAITGGLGEEAVRGWRFAHLGLTVGGIWLIAISGAAGLISIPRSLVAVFVWSLVASGYGFVFALILGPIFAVRGLQPIGPAANLAVFAGNFVGAAGSLVGLGVMLYGASATLQKTRSE